jgi:hypothetical protein
MSTDSTRRNAFLNATSQRVGPSVGEKWHLASRKRNLSAPLRQGVKPNPRFNQILKTRAKRGNRISVHMWHCRPLRNRISMLSDL